jgi:hypothetical protein
LWKYNSAEKKLPKTKNILALFQNPFFIDLKIAKNIKGKNLLKDVKWFQNKGLSNRFQKTILF